MSLINKINNEKGLTLGKALISVGLIALGVAGGLGILKLGGDVKISQNLAPNAIYKKKLDIVNLETKKGKIRNFSCIQKIACFES